MGKLIEKGNFEASNFNHEPSARLKFDNNGTTTNYMYDYDRKFKKDTSGGKRKSRRNRKNKKSRRKSLRKTNRRR